jgi:hypothetical protein
MIRLKVIRAFHFKCQKIGRGITENLTAILSRLQTEYSKER